jgi:hypothetical protein
MPIPKWLKGAPTLPKYEKDPRNVGSTNFAYSGMIGGSPDLAGPPSPAEIELWRKQRAEKVARGEDPGMLLCSDMLGFEGVCWQQTKYQMVCSGCRKRETGEEGYEARQIEGSFRVEWEGEERGE